MLIHVRFGSVAVSHYPSTRMAASGQKQSPANADFLRKSGQPQHLNIEEQDERVVGRFLDGVNASANAVTYPCLRIKHGVVFRFGCSRRLQLL